MCGSWASDKLATQLATLQWGGRPRPRPALAGDSAWLSLNQIADLFQRDKSVISKHIKNIFDEEELDPFRTVAKFATVQIEGARSVAREIEFYRLEVILAVGYRVKSARGTQFRRWAPIGGAAAAANRGTSQAARCEEFCSDQGVMPDSCKECVVYCIRAAF